MKARRCASDVGRLIDIETGGMACGGGQYVYGGSEREVSCAAWRSRAKSTCGAGKRRCHVTCHCIKLMGACGRLEDVGTADLELAAR